MNNLTTRREFLKNSALFAAGAAALAGAPSLFASGANEKLRMGVIGCNGRGMNHISSLPSVPNVEIAYVCDVDKRALEKGLAAVAKKQTSKVQGVADLRRVLEDADVDAITIATPEHWQTPATVLACAAGKHVYVEKPASHNGYESELIVRAARKHKRVVQMGNQRRSWPWVIESIEALHSGAVGEVFFARGWYSNRRPSIGIGKPVPVPEWLDYSLWQGPAPEKVFRDNILHYNWHWFWHWGTGEMGNNAVHALDLARWGLKVELPVRTTCGGNRYFFQDDWETPDTASATFDFGGKGIVWEGHSCAPHGFESTGFGVNFYGDKGCLSMAGSECNIYDVSRKLVRTISAKQAGLFQYDVIHFANFAEAVREGKPLRSGIEEGQKSTLMCHLANLAWRTGQTVDFDPKAGKIVGNKAASALWKREYRKGWEPRV